MSVDRPEDDPTKMTLGEHLEELRWRIIYALAGLAVGMIVAMIFGKGLIALLKQPYDVVMTSPAAKEKGWTADLAAMGVTEPFITYFRVSLIGGLILTSPWVFYQLWRFIAAGLYPNEKRYVHFAVPLSAALFVTGALFFLKVLSIPVLSFFMRFAGWLDLRPVIKLQDYILFMTRMMLVFGVCFQTPLLMMLLVKMGILSIPTLRRYRRHAIVGILILSAILTSPSPVDQIGLAIPMYLLYELGILLGYLWQRSSRRRPAE